MSPIRAAGLPGAPPASLTAEGGTLLSAALVDAVTSSQSAGARTWRKALFRIFFLGESQAVFFFFPWGDTERQTNNTSVNMKNPLYWAMLVGMTVLLMEQGKWWIVFFFSLHPRSTCYLHLRVSLERRSCQTRSCRGQRRAGFCAHIWHDGLSSELRLKWRD